MLENVSYNQQTHSTRNAHQSYSKETSIVSSSTDNGAESGFMDKVTLQGESTVTLTYSSSMTLNGDEGARYSMLQGLVANLLKEQGIDTMVMAGDTEIDITALTPKEAQELIADDGYFGVEQTSDRIFQFAVGIAGGDPARLDAVKEGVEQGFQEALDAFGGWLPDISYQTYDAVMERLDQWAAESETVA